jgi:putative nucleotidyltransferase with HDIG domain
MKLMNVIYDPSSTLDQLVDVIKYDQAVTGEVLRLCNSAYFGLSRTITSLHEALLCLGAIKVLQLVMSVHTNSMLSQEQQGYGLERGALWKHSVAVALTAATVAQRIETCNVNVAFTAGLLHDVGKVVLNEYVAKEFAEIVQLVTEENIAFSEAEHKVLGFSHQEIGGRIAEIWRLPDTIVQSVRWHHEPGALDPPDVIVDVVHVANCICLLFGIGIGKAGLWCRADNDVLKRYGLQGGDLELIGAQMLVDLKQVEQLFAESAAKAGTPAPVAAGK